jgi:hypothetical protein
MFVHGLGFSCFIVSVIPVQAMCNAWSGTASPYETMKA